ncbi:MAG TPA: DMT family transporter [Methyloceanibacter sp.]|nr:DMT family transporter [Methyloceanibacter sp.]
MWSTIMACSIPPAVSLSLACALWGIATVISKAILASVPPITFLVIQLVPSVFVLWILVATRGGHAQTWRGLLPLALLGLLNPGLAYTLSMLGLAQTTASVATLLWAAEPALIVVTAWLLLQETITVRFLAATAAAACGVLLVSGVVGGGHVLTAGAYGSALILGGVFCCALYTVFSRRIASTIDPLPAVAIQQTAGLAWVVAIWPLEPRGDAIGSLAALSNQELLGGTVSGLMYYAAAFWFYLNALRSVPATTASILLNLTPVFGVATAYVFLGERLTASQWLGAAIILISVLALLTWAAAPRVHAS